MTDPDIVRQILRHVDGDRATLCAATRVNKTWFSEAIDILWQELPILHFLAVGADRRQIYATRVRHIVLSLWVADDLHEALAPLEFPRLRRLTLANGWSLNFTCGGTKVVSRYLRPSVKELVLSSGRDMLRRGTYEMIFEQARDNCPGLDTVIVFKDSLPLTQGQLLKLVECLPNVVTLMLVWTPVEDAIGSEALRRLASLQKLKNLSISQRLGDDLLEPIGRYVPEPFRSLEQVQLWLSSSAVATLVSVLGPSAMALENLVLVFDDFDPCVLSVLAGAPFASRLRALELSYASADAVFGAADVIQLAKMTSLRRLIFRAWPDNGQKLRAPGFGDDMFAALVARLPQMRHLVFGLHCDLTVQSLRRIGGACPLLEVLHLEGVFVLLDVGHEGAPLLPRLRKLSLGSAHHASESKEHRT